MQSRNYKWRGLTCQIDDATQYSTVYDDASGAIVGTIIRAPVLARHEFEWSIYDVNGVPVKSSATPLPCLSALSKYLGYNAMGQRAA